MTLRSTTSMIETERLCLRRMDESDLAFFIEIHQDPDVARYIGGANPRPPAETEKGFSDIQDSYRTVELGPLTVIRKAHGRRIGLCGLSDAVIERQDTPGRLRKGWFFSVQAPPSRPRARS